MSRFSRAYRWLTLVGTSAFLFQGASCDLTLQAIQTALLGGIAGGLYYLARNV
jgi:hypothetical protein